MKKGGTPEKAELEFILQKENDIYKNIAKKPQSIIFNDLAEAVIEVIEEKFPPDEYYENEQFNERSKFIKKISKELYEYISYYENEYSYFLSTSKELQMKWLLKRKNVMKRIGNTKFFAIYEYLWKNRITSLKETRDIFYKITEKSKLSKFKSEDSSEKYAYVLPDIVDIANKLKISVSTVNKYLKAFSEYGVIKRFPKRMGLGGRIVYAIGERDYYPDKVTKKSRPRILKYLKSTNKAARF
jgi:DNA-binding MarR family transcriptional regulator